MKKESPNEVFEGDKKLLKRLNCLATVLLVVGFVQMAGYLLDSKTLRGIGLASYTSPLPKVFSDVDGLEIFASSFKIVLKTEDLKEQELQITPELYSKLEGPYKRRNVYGAALSYAPRLPDELWQPVFRFGFSGPLLEEFSLPSDTKKVDLHIKTNTKGRNDSWVKSTPLTKGGAN